MAWLVAFDGPLWAIVALAILATCFSSFFGPTIGAYLPSLVRDERELGPANSAWSTLDNLAFVIGPAVGGDPHLGERAGPGVLPQRDLVRRHRRGPVAPAVGAGHGARADAGRGWAKPPRRRGRRRTRRPVASRPAPRPWPWRRRSAVVPLVGLGMIDVVTGFVFGGLGVLTVVIAIDQLGADEAATGYLNAAIGVGGILGAIGSGAFVVRPSLRGPLLVGAFGLAVGVAVPRARRRARAGPRGDGDRLGRQPPDRGRQHDPLPADRARRDPRTRARDDRDGLDAGLCHGLARPAGRLGDHRGRARPPRVGRPGRGRSGGLGRAHRSAAPRTLRLRSWSRLPGGSPGCPSSLACPRPGWPTRSAGRARSTSRPGRRHPRGRSGGPVLRHRRGVVRRRPGDAGRRGSRRLRTMGPDEVFGELGLLTEAPRSATVRAATPTVGSSPSTRRTSSPSSRRPRRSARDCSPSTAAERRRPDSRAVGDATSRWSQWGCPGRPSRCTVDRRGGPTATVPLGRSSRRAAGRRHRCRSQTTRSPS